MLKILNALTSTSRSIATSLSAHTVDTLKKGDPLLQVAVANNYDLILVEDRMNIVPLLKATDPRAEIIVCGDDSTNSLAEVNKGAYAYITSQIEMETFRKIIDSIREMVSIRQENAQLENRLYSQYTFCEKLVGRNPRMLDIINLLRRIAPYYHILTVSGETGTGKEVIAESLHSLSPAAKGPFVICDCGALVDTLSESELFGHKKGSFTDAIADKTGFFESASGGTLFLDEIAELPPATQTNLLRVLQSGEFRRIGENGMQQANCRVIVATNKDLLQEIQKGRFREDLYYRISAIKIDLPPLRDRKDDIPLLTRFFLEKFSRMSGKTICGVSRPAQNILLSYNWPGNIRELKNVIEEAAIMTAESFIGKDDLPSYLRDIPLKQSAHPFLLEDVITKHIRETLNISKGNRTKAAQLLGISRRTLLRKIKEDA